MMQFNYAGEGKVVLANGALEGEVTAFLRHLHQEGFEYNKSWQRPLKGSGLILG